MSVRERFQTSLYSRRHNFCGSEETPHLWGGLTPLVGDRCHRCGARYELTGIAWHEVDPELVVLR